MQKPTESELTEYYLKLSKTKHKPVLLSLVNGFNDDFVPLYVKGILPQPDDVTAEQFTSTPDLVEDEEDNGLWCYCRQDEHYDTMIACDSESRTIEWFHLSYVNLTQAQVPSGNWYYTDCAANEEV